MHKVQGSEMLFLKQDRGADSSRRQWVQHSPRNSRAGGGISDACHHLLLAVAEVQHSWFSFVFSLGLLYFISLMKT